MTSSQLPTFESAVQSFRRFIGERHQCVEIDWIFREDIVALGRKVFVRKPLACAEDLVEERYIEGVERGFGIKLQAYCFLDGHALCYIWLPKSEEDADYRMLSGFKFSVPAEPERRKVNGVSSRMRWRWLSWLESRRSQYNWADDIPRRSRSGQIR